MSSTYGYNVSFLEQKKYELSDNKTGLLGYPGVLTETLSDLETMMANSSMKNYVTPWIMVIIAIIGIILNVVNVVVFTRPSMVAPLNILLGYLELANIVIYMGHIFHKFINMFIFSDGRFGCDWEFRVTIVRIVFLGAMFVSNWCNVTIGVYRFVAVTWPLKAAKWCSSRNAKLSALVIGLSYMPVGSVLYCLNIATHDVVAVYQDVDSEAPLFFKKRCMVYSAIPFEDVTSILRLETALNFFLFTIPCFIAALFTVLLFRNLCLAKKRRRSLFENSEVSDENDNLKKKTDAETRVTKMLLVVLALLNLSNLSYLPVTVYNIAQLTGNEPVIIPELNIMSEAGIAILLANLLTFFVYVTMSQRYRETLLGLFSRPFQKYMNRSYQGAFILKTPFCYIYPSSSSLTCAQRERETL